MPLYEYKCEKCGDTFEVMQKFSDEPLTTHEKCGGKVERLISPPALQFKGSGWYITDYGKTGSGTPAAENGSKAESTTKSSGDSGASTSSTPAASSSDSKSTASESKASSSGSKSTSSE